MSRAGSTMAAGSTARGASGDTSPEVEFTFLRPTHQPRTLARPASSYLSNPTSPTPPSRPTSPPPVPVAVPSASQQRALSPKPMRNGAPRLGGLGLGGIAPPEPPPHFRSPSLARPAPTPPPRPASAAQSNTPPPLPERRPASPATFAPSAAAITTRPFLSPEMDKPTVRTGAFALDTHVKPEQVLPGPRSRGVTPEGAKGESTGAATPAEAAASGARPDVEPADGKAVEEDSKDELEQAPHEPEWLQPSPQAERSLDSLAFAPVAEPSREVETDRFLAGDPTSLLGAVAAQPSSGTVGAGLVESDGSDDEDGDFDDARSTTAPSLAASADDAPVVSVDDHNVAPAQPHAAVVPEEDEPEQDEEVVLDGPSSVSPASSRPPSTSDDIAADELADDEQANAPLVVSPSDERAQHVAVALLARAERSSSSAGSHSAAGDDVDDVIDDESVAVSSPALSRSASFAGSLESEYSTHEPVDEPSDLAQLGPDEPAPAFAEPPFAPTSQVEAAHDESLGDKEDQRDAAAVYPSPPSSPSSSPVPELTSSAAQAANAATADPPAPVEAAQPPAAGTQSPRSSLSSAPSLQHLARPSTLPASPSFNTYAGLGLRLPSSLGRSKRSSFVPPASPPVSPETAEHGLPTLVISDASVPHNELAVTPSSPQKRDDVKEDEPVRDELSAPTVPVATSPIARDYAHLPPELNTPTTADEGEADVAPPPSAAAEPDAARTPRSRREAELPAFSDEPAVFSSADVLAAPVFGDDDEFTPASSASNSPALTARTAGSDFAADDDDVPEAALPAPSHVERDEPLVRDAAPPASAAAAVEEPAGPSGPGVVDVGVAVAGALVMGGLAVGTSALRGLAGWAWRSEPAATAAPAAQAEVPVVRVEPPVQDGTAEEQKVPGSIETAVSATSSERAESSVVSTDWGEMEFDAPDGFLDEFKQAMQEIGVAELEAEDLAAQQAAYLSASRQHDEALEGEPRPSPTSSSTDSTPAGSVRTLVFPSVAPRSSRPSSISGASVRSARRRQRPLTPADEGDEMDELDRMLAPVWDGRGYVKERRASPAASVAPAAPAAPASPTKFGYAAPPGLAGSTPLSRVLSPPSSALSRSTSSVSSSLSSRAPPAVKQQPQQQSSSRFGRSLFALGSSSKEPKSSKGAKLKKGRPEYGSSASPPSPTKVSSPKVASPQSAKSLSSIDEDGRSAYTSASHKPPSRRRSFVSFGGASTIGSGGSSATPVTSIESRIADTTYVHYGSSTPKAKRRESAASIAADLYASRDPVLIPGVPASPSAFTSLLPPPQPASGAPRRRSSLRAPQAESKLARVRFANATRGLGLRSVAEDEAERGGDDVALKWIGVGRGRYGNLTIKEGEEMDILYDDQVKSIKGKWRSFGSEQSRDWSNVRID